MTYEVIQFHSSKGEVPGQYIVGFKGDERFVHKLLIFTQADLGPDALDYIELYAMWLYIMALEFAGNSRSSRNLRLVVSRGAIKKLLRETSSKSHLFQYTNALRTQLYGLRDIEVVKNPGWVTEVEPMFCVKWDGSVPPYPEVENPVAGKVGITYHAVERYYDATKREGRADLVFTRACKVLRDASIQVQLPSDIQQHKERKYGDENLSAIHVQTPSGWRAVILATPGQQKIATTIYKRES